MLPQDEQQAEGSQAGGEREVFLPLAPSYRPYTNTGQEGLEEHTPGGLVLSRLPLPH